jgi:2-polyprenyl-3-methyl-5-hydroxy-6-metoxy-1,4-benzoquinol methylase
MDKAKHWQEVYQTKAAGDVSWYAPHLTHSLDLITQLTSPTSQVIDIGGGASTLVDDLVRAGYQNLTVLDISPQPLELARLRLGSDGASVTWMVADVTRAQLPAAHYDLWHDRAVFHFLTDPADRAAYAEKARQSLKPGGHLLIATFALDGPAKCSGLDVVRFDARSLAEQLPGFALLREGRITHVTPGGNQQQFLQCLFRRE